MPERPLTDAELDVMTQRLRAASPSPWLPWLETRDAIDGESFIQIGEPADEDNEMYVRRYIGTRELTAQTCSWTPISTSWRMPGRTCLA